MRQALLVFLVGWALFLPPVSFGQEARNPVVEGFRFDYGQWPYPLNDEIGRELQELAASYPGLARAHRIGESRRGKDLWIIELTNFATGPGGTKPGLWLDGNIHAHELTGRQYLRYFVHRLLYSYGKDELSTRMLDTRTFYVMPVFDADGGDMVLSRHPAWPGYDASEHVGTDLDGDGYITQMRVPDATSDEGYRYYTESLELLDVRVEPEFLERRRRDPLTGQREGPDFNRNWSAEWEADEPGAGPRPFSLPEVGTVADFILDHDNIFFTYTIHSGGGSRSYMVRPPMDRPYDWMNGEDNHFYMRVGAIWAYLSGGGLTENNYYSYLFTTSRLDENGEPRGYSDTMAGFNVDWAYMDAGLHHLSPEVNGSGWDYNKDGWIRPQEEERWHREEKGGMFDSPWSEVEHPSLGVVEVGGSRGMPPALDQTLQFHCEIQYDFLLYIAGLSPLISITELTAEPLGDGLHRVTATLQNIGGLPTYLTQRAIELRRDMPLVATIDIEGGEVIEGGLERNLGHIQGFVAGAFEATAPLTDFEWVVRADSVPVSVSIRVGTPKAGYAEASTEIGR